MKKEATIKAAAIQSQEEVVTSKYQSKLSLMETELAIKFVKDHFERSLASALDLVRVSAPMMVFKETGLNDDLNGVERPVGFDIGGKAVEVVHSLAKWKRQALARYEVPMGKGLYTDMNAIRRDERLDALHSIYVDQWDWEKVISSEARDLETLKGTVRAIYKAIRETAIAVSQEFSALSPSLPEDIFFIDSQELEDLYPQLTAKEREQAICQKLGAVFVMGIGAPLTSGIPHDGRAPDYDDWSLNGDILVWHEPLKCAFEISSMGIRVDAKALKAQLLASGQTHRQQLPFHQALLAGDLPQTIGGGIGQSRLCMFLLEKVHIGEVQVSVWDEGTLEMCEAAGIVLL